MKRVTESRGDLRGEHFGGKRGVIAGAGGQLRAGRVLKRCFPAVVGAVVHRTCLGQARKKQNSGEGKQYLVHGHEPV